MQEKQHLLLLCLAFLLTSILFESLNILWVSLFFTSYFLFFLLKNLGGKILFLEIVIFNCVLETLMGPAIFHSVDRAFLEKIRLTLFVPKEYFALAFPCLILFIIGLLLPITKSFEWTKHDLLEKLYTSSNKKKGYYLVAIGVVAQLLTQFAPGGLQYYLFLFSNLQIIGITYLLFDKTSVKIGYVFLFIFLLRGLLGGMIGEFLWPLVFIATFLTLRFNLSLSYKLAGFTALVFLAFLLQSIKGDYRSVTWYGRGNLTGKTGLLLYSELAQSRLRDRGKFFSLENSIRAASRINQGYLTSLALAYVPNNEPFAKGETLFTGFFASLIPRFIWPDKPKAGGAEMMRRFTGIKLEGSTSMNIGNLGEAYVNYGYFGAPILLFFYGILINLMNSVFLKKSITSPQILFWLPLFFSGLTGLGSDFLTTLNHITKVSLFILFVFPFFDKIK